MKSIFIAIALFAGLSIPSQLLAQDSEVRCREKMDRCWKANRNNEYCNTKFVCGWRTGIFYKDFIAGNWKQGKWPSQ